MLKFISAYETELQNKSIKIKKPRYKFDNVVFKFYCGYGSFLNSACFQIACNVFAVLV